MTTKIRYPWRLPLGGLIGTAAAGLAVLIFGPVGSIAAACIGATAAIAGMAAGGLLDLRAARR